MVLHGSVLEIIFSNYADQSLIADNITTTGSDVATSDSPPGLIHSEGGVVSRGRWSDKEEFVLETGLPSMTQVSRVYPLYVQCAK